MKNLKMFIILCSITALSCSSDDDIIESASAKWTGEYSGELTFKETFVNDGSIQTTTYSSGLKILEGQSDDNIVLIFRMGSESSDPVTVAISDNVAHLSNITPYDYEPFSGQLTRQIDGSIILEMKGTHLPKGATSTVDEYSGVLKRMIKTDTIADGDCGEIKLMLFNTQTNHIPYMTIDLDSKRDQVFCVAPVFDTSDGISKLLSIQIQKIQGTRYRVRPFLDDLDYGDLNRKRLVISEIDTSEKDVYKFTVKQKPRKLSTTDTFQEILEFSENMNVENAEGRIIRTSIKLENDCRNIHPESKRSTVTGNRLCNIGLK